MNPSTPPSTTAVELAEAMPESRLGPMGAFFGALVGRKLEHYPRFPQADGSWKKTPDAEMIDRVAAGLANLKSDAACLEDAVARGRETLDEVKELTEYQDQKATRLLTIITFLSALSGILFARLVEGYPLHSSLAQADLGRWAQALIVISYTLFGIFVFLAVCGALVVFHATRTQFRYPDSQAGARQRASSYLFYKSIIEVTPEAWARSFVADASGNQLTPDLQLRYLRNYIVESYLVAAKVAEKLRYLQPAQVILSCSIRVLLFWLIFLAATIVLVPIKSQTSAPSSVSAAGAPAPFTEPADTPIVESADAPTTPTRGPTQPLTSETESTRSGE